MELVQSVCFPGSFHDPDLPMKGGEGKGEEPVRQGRR